MHDSVADLKFEAKLSDAVSLKVEWGSIEARHVIVSSSAGRIEREGVVLLSKDIVSANGPVLLRLQSSCLFSESFGAQDCDCALQLRSSIQLISQQPGVIIYFYEEGRGAGLLAKFKAINLQQVFGYSTRDAYSTLQMRIDSRTYDSASAVLRILKPKQSYILLTNNPDKEQRLKGLGVNVLQSRPLVCGMENASIREYLLDKQRVLGHRIESNNGEYFK